MGHCEAQAESNPPDSDPSYEEAIKLLTANPSDAKAMDLLAKAADAGHAAAANRLGYQYDQGLGVPKDLEQARKYFEIAAKGGLPKARYNLAKTLLLGSDPDIERSIQLLGQAAAEGIEPASFALGSIYFDGLYNQKQNPALALWYFEQSASAGNPEAQNFCGAMYEMGEGTKINFSNAATWYRAAAASGHAKAQASYGDMLYSGRGVQKDRVEGLKFLMLAADQGDQVGVRLQEEYLPGFSNEEIEKARRAADNFQPLSKDSGREQI
jgi:hypothetical protein